MSDFDALVDAFLSLCRADEHLPGQHDQADHAGGGGSGGGDHDSFTGLSRGTIGHIKTRDQKQKQSDISKLAKSPLSVLRRKQDEVKSAMQDHAKIGMKYDGWMQGKGSGEAFNDWDSEGIALSEMFDDLRQAVDKKSFK